MNIDQRVRKVLNWLIYEEYGNNYADLAKKMGYNTSSLSQIMNQKVPISDNFIDKLCNVSPNINKLWVANGEGTMLKSDENVSESALKYDRKSHLQPVRAVSSIDVDSGLMQVVREQSATIREQSATIREQSATIREQSATIREQSGNIKELSKLLGEAQEESKKTVVPKGARAISATAG